MIRAEGAGQEINPLDWTRGGDEVREEAEDHVARHAPENASEPLIEAMLSVLTGLKGDLENPAWWRDALPKRLGLKEEEVAQLAEYVATVQRENGWVETDATTDSVSETAPAAESPGEADVEAEEELTSLSPEAAWEAFDEDGYLASLASLEQRWAGKPEYTEEEREQFVQELIMVIGEHAEYIRRDKRDGTTEEIFGIPILNKSGKANVTPHHKYEEGLDVLLRDRRTEGPVEDAGSKVSYMVPHNEKVDEILNAVFSKPTARSV